MSDTQKITGKVINVLPSQTGSGKKGNWEKQTFIIETGDQYPKKIAFTAWNDKCNSIPKTGTEVTVSYNPESREYNDKWYTELNVWKIESGKKKETEKEPVKTGLDLEQDSEDDLPF